jgi:hypothetical protein
MTGQSPPPLHRFSTETLELVPAGERNPLAQPMEKRAIHWKSLCYEFASTRRYGPTRRSREGAVS